MNHQVNLFPITFFPKIKFHHTTCNSDRYFSSLSTRSDGPDQPFLIHPQPSISFLFPSINLSGPNFELFKKKCKNKQRNKANKRYPNFFGLSLLFSASSFSGKSFCCFVLNGGTLSSLALLFSLYLSAFRAISCEVQSANRSSVLSLVHLLRLFR